MQLGVSMRMHLRSSWRSASFVMGSSFRRDRSNRAKHPRPEDLPHPPMSRFTNHSPCQFASIQVADRRAGPDGLARLMGPLREVLKLAAEARPDPRAAGPGEGTAGCWADDDYTSIEA